MWPVMSVGILGFVLVMCVCVCVCVCVEMDFPWSLIGLWDGEDAGMLVIAGYAIH